MDKPRIMVVEDEGIVALDIQDSLERLGYHGVEVMSSGEEALAKAPETKPDLILMDIRLGEGLDGIETATAINDKLDIPIVYLTAFTDEKTVKRAKVTEPFGYLIKPFIEKEIQTTIEMALYKHAMEKELRQREQWLSTTLSSIGDGVIATDAEGKILFMNAEAQKLTAWKEEDAVDKDINQVLEIVGEEGEPLPADPLHEILRTGETTMLPESAMVKAKDGHMFHAEDSAAPIVSRNGELSGVVVVFRDASEKIAAAEALRKSEEELRHAQRLESLGRLAGGVAHDFNNLLTAITGFSELILASIGDEDPIRRHVEEIKRAGTKASTLTQRLLSFGRRQMLFPKPLDLNDVVVGMMEMLKRSLGTNARLEARLEPHLPVLKADQGQIEQVIMNLVLNARDAMPDGGRIIVKTGTAAFDAVTNALTPPDPDFDSGPGNYVVLSVEDEGIGMDEAIKSRIFEPFFTTKEVGRGTGLGLPMVYGFVKQSAGCVTVTSELHKGSDFRVYFPVPKPTSPVSSE
jgi:PAS domain S-box-containing protein